MKAEKDLSYINLFMYYYRMQVHSMKIRHKFFEMWQLQILGYNGKYQNFIREKIKRLSSAIAGTIQLRISISPSYMKPYK
jgi:hypothetical protein